MDCSDTLKYSYQILQALRHLHESGVVHHCLDWNCLNLNSKGDVQLVNYAAYYASAGGVLISCPLDIPRYIPPETIMSTALPHNSPIPECDTEIVMSGSSYDIWCLGMLLLEMATQSTLWEFLSLKQIFSKLILLFDSTSTDEELLQEILKSNKLEKMFEVVDPILQRVIRGCLKKKPKERCSCFQLMKFYPESLRLKHSVNAASSKNRAVCLFQEFREPFVEFSKVKVKSLTPPNFLFTRQCDEIFHLWQLAGGNLSKETQKQGMLKLVFQICRFPNSISRDGCYTGNEGCRIMKASDRILELPLSQLQSKLSHLPYQQFFPLICYKNDKEKSVCDQNEAAMKSMACNIKEVDVEYQLKRIVMFHRLLRGFPVTAKLLYNEALIDIPPHYRGSTWAAILHQNCQPEYTLKISHLLEDIDFSKTLPSDKQIEVDIPRCHQYHTLLSSPTAHGVLRTVIRAWVISNPHLVYWQGLDSLAAPFVCLHFNNPALAFSCLSQFIKQFLYNFFLSDNSAIIQEYLACFSQIIAFHDPELFYHLHQENFSPNLYAMPWFLTMFAHTFPMSKIYHLWDTLILQGPSFPLFIGAAILKLLRNQLLSVDFDGAILLFSDIPEVEVEAIKTVSLQLFHVTPPSCAARQWVNPDLKSTQFFRCTSKPSNLSAALADLEYPLQERQADWCPRIHPSDVLSLFELKQSPERDSSDIFGKWDLSKFVVFDIRSKSEFERGHLPDSVNISVSVDYLTNEQDKVILAVNESLSNENNSLIIVVAASHSVSLCRDFCTLLIKSRLPRVCFVHGGIDSFASTNMLIVS